MAQKFQSVFRCYWLENRLTKTPVSSSYRRIRFSRHLLHVYGHWNPFTKQAIEKLNTLRTIVPISTGETKGKEGETVAQFAARLRQLAVLCDFLDDSVDSFISDQLTDNCLTKNLQTKLTSTLWINISFLTMWVFGMAHRRRKMSDASSSLSNRWEFRFAVSLSRFCHCHVSWFRILCRWCWAFFSFNCRHSLNDKLVILDDMSRLTFPSFHCLSNIQRAI